MDPSQLGQDGSGGSPNAEARALLENKNVVLDDVGVSDIKAGKIDPRIVAVLTELSQEHKIVVSCMCSDHSKFTAGGSISNHAFGRGLDIASIDGEIVSPGSALAREVASELSDFDPQIRPDEIGSPFAIAGPGYFTDADHHDHIHVGFKQEITPGFKLPAELAAGGAQRPAAAQAAPVAGAPGAGAVVDAPAGGGGESSLGAAALRIAQTQRGVREVGTNTGPQVDDYLEATGVAPGNPWCAAFVTWSLEQAGHKMPGSGWAGVASWVRNAEQGGNGLKLVSAEEARPGDIAAYDWGGGSDFGADGHIGFLASGVKDGQFSALEGNNADAVNLVPRRLGAGANVVFIRVEGDAPAGAAPAAAPAAPAPAAPVAAPAAVPARDPNKQSGLFAAVAQPGQLASAAPDPAKPGDSQLFLKAVEGQAKAAPAGAPAADAAAPAAPALDIAAPAGYPGDDAPKEQIAAWMAAEAKKRGLPPQLPVMASLVESGLKNLNFGDADSVGYFQMRLSIWNNQPDYAGYPDDPDKQLDWFLDQAEAIKAQRVSRGQPIDDPSQFGEWIADVERPAEQFRGRYQLQLGQANQLLQNATPPPPEAAPTPAAAAQPAVEPSGAVDPSQLGQDGSGGSPNAEARALLENKNVVLDDVGVSDIKAGKIDPRIVAVLTELSQEHKIVVSCMCSDHSKFTAGGSISNHAFGRGLDIASIDGEIVSPGSTLAREVASELSDFDPQIRPDEIGSPFAIAGPGYFTDADHHDHIHVGFKQEITPGFKLPAELAAGGAPPRRRPPEAAAAAGAPAPVAAAAAVPARDPNKQSGLFAAVAQPGQLASAAPDPAKPGDSQLFLKAVEGQAKAAPAGAPAADAAAPAAPALDIAAPAGYPGDDAPKEQIAAWMAAEAKKRGLPPQLPVMASLVESGLKNLNFGDADSVGYFQMRLSIWNNQPDYAGYPDDPDKQLDWFLDQAEAIKAQRVSRGQPIDDPSQFGEWIADVERPAEQFRGRYQLQLGQANQLLQNATPPPPEAAPTPAQPADQVADAAPAPPAMAKGAGPQALAALKEAEKYTGTPYRWGGSTPQTGFDCSGLVQWAYAQAGVKIPRVTGDQIAAANGTPVARAELLPGDLVFFRDASGYVHHVGISMGGDKFLHAPHTGDVVKVSSLNEPYYKEQFTGGRRFDSAAAAAAPAAPVAPAAPAAAPAAPAIDPVAVAAAQAAVARDAAEAQQEHSGLFKAINAQEARNHAALGGDRVLASAGEGKPPRDSALFLKAITEEDAAKARAASQQAAPAEPAPARPRPSRHRHRTLRRARRRTSPRFRPTTPATTPARRHWRSGSPRRRTRPASRPSCR